MKNPRKKLIILIGLKIVLAVGVLMTIYHHISNPTKIVYLTFDDGPSIYTEDLLDILKERNIPAIFFILGKSIEITPNSHDIIKRIYAENHHLGLHSMTHQQEKLYSLDNSPQIFVEEMMELKHLLGKILGGYETNLCRAPFGLWMFNKGHWKATKKAGLNFLDWNIDSKDWELQNAGEIFEKIVKDAEKLQFPNTIVILFHENNRTVEVLPQTIDYFQEKGYIFVPYFDAEKKSFHK